MLILSILLVQKLADEVSEALASVNPRLTGSRQSVSTLSPCDSLTSDDLMVDFDTSDFDEFVLHFNQLYF